MGVHSSMLVSLVCCFITILSISKTNAEQTSQQFEYFCDNNNDTANSTYQKNLNTILSNLNSDTKNDYGFYNSSYGEEPDKVNAIGMCRGDIKPNECRSCLNYAKANLTQLCLYRKEAIGWYQDEICMLRYSNRSIFGLMEDGPAYYKWNSKNASDADRFNQVVKNLLDSLRSKAASGDSRRKFSVGTVTSPGQGNQTIYGLVQCTPDLSKQDCDYCLNQSIAVLPDCCDNKIGARVVRPSCSFRYETASPFYDASAEAPSSSLSLSPPLLPLPTQSPQGMNNTSSSAATTVPLLLLLGLCLCVSI